MTFYEQIRNDNLVKYGTEVKKYIHIIINQYSDRTHFIYEVIQNAEDAGATQISFCLRKNELAIYHNGRPFNQNDVIGVCGIANGTKEDGTRIGHFGIGFKAVYGYSDTPMIYSGDMNFKIVDYINPYELPAKRDLEKDETCIVLPFDKQGVSKEVAYNEIRDALTKKISAESILMLTSIVDVKVDIEDYKKIVTINKEMGSIGGSENVFDINLQTCHIDRKTNEIDDEIQKEYLYFTDGEERAAAIVFRKEGKEIQELLNNKVFAYFPMAVESHQNFYIQAPFDTNPARNEILQGTEYGRNNIELISRICQLINFAFIWLRDNEYLTLSSLKKVYPIYKYDESSILYDIFQNGVDFINEGEPILPTNTPGVFKGISEICAPENQGIANVFSDDDLHELTHNWRLFWIAKEISTREYAAFKEYLDDNFRFATYDWRALVRSLTASFLKKKNVEWLDRLCASIVSFCSNSLSTHYINVADIPFVRLATGEQICARENGELQVYLNNPEECKYRIASEVLRKENIRHFYEVALRIPNFDIVQETLNKILPKYDTCNVNFNTEDHIRENIEDLKAIKDAITANPNVLNEVTGRYVVTDGKSWYRPYELHIDGPDSKTGYGLVRGIVDLKFLSVKYSDDTVMNIRLDEDFFRKIGCSYGLRTIEVSKYEYLQAVKKYIDSNISKEINEKVLRKDYISQKWNWAFCYEGFPAIFENISVEKSKKIAAFLNYNLSKFEIRGDLVGANDKNFSGKEVGEVYAFSMLGLMLCHEKWVYVQNNPEPQRPIDVDREDLISGYEPAKRLIEKLPFKEVKNALNELIYARIKNKNDADIFIRAMDDPEQLVELIKAKVKHDAKIESKEAKKTGIKERFEHGDKEQKEADVQSSDKIEINPISEKALAKREEKLEQEFIASLGKQTKVARGLQYVRKTCNEQEKLFLEQEYDGLCQMCEKKIIKHDGNVYFEAINIIKAHELYDKLLGALDYGWNSLSLCPNCAAEYNYCSKKISNIYDQVMSTEIEPNSEYAIEIDMELPMGEPRKIIYSPRHFLALKKAFEIFAKEE